MPGMEFTTSEIPEMRTQRHSWSQDSEDQSWGYVECGCVTKACGFQSWNSGIAPSLGMNAGC